MDRNKRSISRIKVCIESLSARRAWIEILMKCQAKKYSGSLSARRAWIEIGSGDYVQYSYNSRSPQGERG